MLRWTLLGPLIGAVLMSPLIWFLGSPFDRGPRSFELLFFTLPIAYLIGVLPALFTGAAYRFMHARAVRPARMRMGVALIGAGSSTYLVWIGLTAELLDGKFSVETLPAAVFFLIPGTVATRVLLAFENHLAQRG